MTTELISLTSAELQANATSEDPGISSDGRYVVFSSIATNLVAGDTNDNWDVFLRDVLGGTTLRVSVNSGGQQADGDSRDAVVSSDGRYVAFHSFAANLVSDDFNGYYDVFVRDVVSGTTERVSVSSLGVEGANDSYAPSLSSDGRYVSFHSMADNLAGGYAPGYDVFVRDRTGAATELISRNTLGASANGASYDASISADGRYVVFSSDATNLVDLDTNLASDIFLRDRVSGTTERVSVDSSETQASGASSEASISANGQFVVFTSTATDLVADDTNGVADIFVRDIASGTTTRVSVDSSGIEADGASSHASISADGRYVTFQSLASKLVDGDGNGASDIFVHDRQTGVTLRIGGNAASETAVLSGDAAYIAFASAATDLVAGDKNSTSDVFLSSRPFVNFAPAIAGGDTATVSIPENTTAVTDVQSSDDIDSEGAGLTYSIANGGTGEDGALFSIDASTGVLSFKLPPDYENPQDQGKDNSYEVVVRVTDSGALKDEQTITVNVQDAGGVTIYGTTGNDTVDAFQSPPGQPLPTSEEDVIYGYEGDDYLDGLAGADTLTGGPGNDVYFVDSPDDVIIELPGEGSNESLFATFNFVLTANFANIEWINLTGSDPLNATGDHTNNLIVGNDAANVIYGLGGDDTLWGHGGSDTYYGGEGNDSFNDWNGGLEYATDDIMFGGKGDDGYIVDSFGDQIIEYSDEGIDGIWTRLDGYELPDNVENLNLEGSAATGIGNSLDNFINGGIANNVLYGLAGNDTLYGDGVGDVSDDILVGGDGADLIDGFDGTDTACYADDTVGVTVDLSLPWYTPQVSAGEADGDRLASIENLIGGSGSDVLTGDGTANRIDGGSGNDTLAGNAGNDTLAGGAGTNELDGGADFDVAEFSGVRADFEVSATAEGYLLTDRRSGQPGGVHTVKNVESFAFDNITLAAGDLLNSAPTGLDLAPAAVPENSPSGVVVGTLTTTDPDTIEAFTYELLDDAGGRFAIGGSSGDEIVVAGGLPLDFETATNHDVTVKVTDIAGNSFTKTINVAVLDNPGLTLTGTSAANVLVGADDDDEIFGLGGNDTLIGLGGNDYLDGGAGYDTASYASDTAGVVVNLITGTATGAGIGTDTLVSIERVIGGSGSDDIIGTDLSTGQRLDGGAGDDYIEGSFGNDTLIGGAGTGDMLSYIKSTGGIKVSLAVASAQKTGAAGTDTISGFENLVGGFGNDILTGSSAANIIYGREGSDIIDGGAGDDLLRGQDGDDTITGAAGADQVYGEDGNDTASYMKSTTGVTISLALGDDVAQGGVGDGLGDKLYSIENLIGSAKNDVLTGDGNDNVVEGGLGNDTLTGGANGAYGDTLSYRGATAAVIASLALQGAAQATGGGGTDTAGGFENLEGGAGADKLTGDANNNKIAGNAGNDIIFGGGINGAGDDTLDGGAGNDTADYSADTAGIDVSLALGTATGAAIGSETLIDIENVTGGTGDDTIEASNGSNKLIGGLGTDELSYANTTGGVKVSLALTSAQVTGGSGTDTVSGFENLTGGSGNDILTGTAGVNVIKGGDGGDTITGGAGGDFLYGEDGDDVLIGGTGADKLFGGAGNDTASYATSALGVTVDLGLGSAPQSSAEDASGDQLDSIENLIGSAKADALTGDANDNVIEGGLGNDTLEGGANGAGGDTVSYASATASVIVNLAAGTATGGGGTDKISGFENVLGGKGADTIISTIGSHILNGGAGIDTVSYASESSPMIISLAGGYTDGVITDTLIGFENVIGSSGDNIIEGDAGNNKLVGGLGDDTLGYAHATSGVKVSLALTSAQVTGGGGTDTISGFENLSGGDFNDVLTGDAGTNLLRGWDGADTLSGGGGSDTLMGDEGDDVLIGGAGADKLYGGDGNDTASYAGSTAGVTVDLNLVHQNGAGDESGDDLYDIENLVGSAKNDTLTGDGGDNVIEGGLGNDTLAAGTHGVYGDTASYRSATATVKVSLALQGTAQATGGGGTDILGGFENLEGGSGSDTLTGDANANVIVGNAGNDIIDGGASADTLIGGVGSDTYLVDDAFDFVVEALNAGTDTVKSTASQYTLSANTENLTLLGTGDIDGTGNELANIITGNSGANVLSGGGGDGKADTLKGGLGDDVYYVEAGDKVTELANQGTDWVHSFVSYTLGNNIENLQLEIAGGSIDGTGNTLANIISGNVHDNVLNGKAGNDRLIGGDGLDTFVFNTTLNATTNVDTIADFLVGEDLIHLENAIFTAVGAAGALSADAFWAGVAAHDATDRIIYDSSTGALYYDRDGTGTAAQVQFAVLESKPATLSEADFLVI